MLQRKEQRGSHGAMTALQKVSDMGKNPSLFLHLPCRRQHHLFRILAVPLPHIHPHTELSLVPSSGPTKLKSFPVGLALANKCVGVMGTYHSSPTGSFRLGAVFLAGSHNPDLTEQSIPNPQGHLLQMRGESPLSLGLREEF